MPAEEMWCWGVRVEPAQAVTVWKCPVWVVPFGNAGPGGSSLVSFHPPQPQSCPQGCPIPSPAQDQGQHLSRSLLTPLRFPWAIP